MLQSVHCKDWELQPQCLSPILTTRMQPWCLCICSSHFLEIGKDTRTSCNLLLQPSFVASFADIPVKSLPSKSFMRRRQVSFDGAFMLWKRTVDASAPVVRWVWMDSSPQAGRDWLQVKELYAREADLVQLYHAVETLALAYSESHDLTMDDEKDATQTIEASLHIHMRIPVAKASGKHPHVLLPISQILR